MLSSTSPSALLQSTRVSQRGALHVSCTLIFTDVAQEHALSHLALLASGACIPGFHRTVAVGQFLAGYHPSSRLVYTPSLSVKEASLLVLELWPKGRASKLAYI